MNTSETKVDVLAVMDAARWCPRMQPQIAVELGQARAAVDRAGGAQ